MNKDLPESMMEDSVRNMALIKGFYDAALKVGFGDDQALKVAITMYHTMLDKAISGEFTCSGPTTSR